MKMKQATEQAEENDGALRQSASIFSVSVLEQVLHV